MLLLLRSRRGIEPSLSVHVVQLSFLRVAEHLVGCVDLLEPSLVSPLVWVVLHGLLAIRLLDLIIRSGFGDAEDPVIVRASEGRNSGGEEGRQEYIKSLKELVKEVRSLLCNSVIVRVALQ